MRYAAIVLCAAVLGASFCSHADSLFASDSAKKGTLIANKNRFETGDIITVTVKEMVDSSVTANTNTKKESSVDAQSPLASNDFLTSSALGGLNNRVRAQASELGHSGEERTQGARRHAAYCPTEHDGRLYRDAGNGKREPDDSGRAHVGHEP